MPSFIFPGNCYKINGLQINEDKKVINQNDENFLLTICSSKKIESTGECVDQCPNSTIFYDYNYDSNINQYTKKYFKSSKIFF